MSLREIMSKDITSLPKAATVSDAAKFMTDMNVGSVIIVEDDKPLGLLTDRDIVSKVIAYGKDYKTTAIGEVMASPIITVSEEKDIVEVTKLMSFHGIRRLPVVDAGGKVVGVVSLHDILVILGREMQYVANALKKGIK
jgi:CBS domain-containing protein